MNYPNNDISNFDVSNVLECAQSCQNVPTCALYAFSKSEKHCWLKTAKGQATLNADILTGFMPKICKYKL